MNTPKNQGGLFVKMGKNPFIKKFNIGDKFYIYDVNKNSFFRVDEILFGLINSDDDLDSYEKIAMNYSKQVVENARNNIKKLKDEKGYFNHKRPEITYFHSIRKEEFPEHLKKTLDKKLHRISLIVTEDCNLRCRYCAYSGKYLFHRKHSKKIMTGEVMRKAIDFYHSHSSETQEKNISFYGGEPLLNFDIIKDCVEYSKEKFDSQVNFNMTINGTLLNGDRAQFFAENNFSLFVSIDGPGSLHDRYRVFKNGKGSFNLVFRNLKNIKNKFPGYYKKKIRFNMVLPPPLDFDAIEEFIENPEISPADIKFSFVNRSFTTFFDHFDQETLDEFQFDRAQIKKSFFEKLMKDKPLTKVEKYMFIMKFLEIHKRNMFRLPDKYPSNGQCMLGERVVLVNTDGDFNFCTQVEDVFNLGNVYTGFNYEYITKLYYDMDRFLAERCKDCWAIRFCTKCIKNINRNGELDDEVFHEYCKKQKKIILQDIKDYIRIREINTDALKHLDNVEVL